MNGEWFYAHKKDCLWTLVAPEGSVIEFELYHIDIDCNKTTDLKVSVHVILNKTQTRGYKTSLGL